MPGRLYVPLNGPEIIEAIVCDVRRVLADAGLSRPHIIYHEARWMIDIDIRHGQLGAREPKKIAAQAKGQRGDGEPANEQEQLKLKVEVAAEPPDKMRLDREMPLRGV